MKQLAFIIRRIWGPFSPRRSAWRLSLLAAPWLIALAIPSMRTLVVNNPASQAVIAHWPFNSDFDSDDTAVTAPRRTPLVGGASSKPAVGVAAIAATLREKSMLVADNLVAAGIESPPSRPGGGQTTAGYPTTSPRTRAQDLVHSYPSVRQSANRSLLLTELHWTKTLATRLLAQARRGEQLEPRNGFFNLFAARQLFALGRDTQALAELHAAAAKPVYNNHSRSLAPVEAPTEFSTFAVPNDGNQQQLELAAIRHTFQLATAAAAHLERTGQHAKALQQYADLMRLAAHMRDGGDTAVEGITSCAFAAIAWAGTSRNVSLRQVIAAGHPLRGGNWLRLGAAKFAKYAGAHGRPDLAVEARGEGERFASLRDRIESITTTSNYWPVRRDAGFALYQYGNWLLPIFITQVLVLLCFRVLIFFSLLPGGLKTEPVTSRDIAIATVALLIFVLGCTAFALDFVGHTIIWGNPDNSYNLTADMVWAFLAVYSAFLAPFLLPSILVATCTAIRQRQARPHRAGLRVQLAALRQSPTQVLQSAKLPRLAGVALAIICWFPIVVAVGGIIMLSGSIYYTAAVVRVLPCLATPEFMWLLTVIPLLFVPISFFGWLLRWRWWPAPQHRVSAHYALAWHRQLLSWWCTVLGWVMLVVLLVILRGTTIVQQNYLRAAKLGELKTLLQASAP